MRISDWSSDVCSSDLLLIYGAGRGGQQLANSLRQEPHLLLVGYIDDDERLSNQHLDGVTVWHSSILDRILEERSEEHTSELQSLMRISYAVFCLKKKIKKKKRVLTTRDDNIINYTHMSSRHHTNQTEQNNKPHHT